MTDTMPSHEIAEEELNECIARIQARLGIEYGDFASVFFTGENGERYDRAVDLLHSYISAERAALEQAQAEEEKEA